MVVLPLYLGGLQPPRSSKRLAQGRECGPNSIALVVRFINTTCQCFFRAGSRADEQHIYDLSSLDDQLVLGIKGTLSVVELKALRQRMQAGQESKARRGELFKWFGRSASPTQEPGRRSHSGDPPGAGQSGILSR